MQQLIPQVSRGANLLGKDRKVHCHTHCLSWLSWQKQTSTCQCTACRYTWTAKILVFKTQINILPQQNWRDNTESERASNEKEVVHHSLVLPNHIHETPICSFLWKKKSVCSSQFGDKLWSEHSTGIHGVRGNTAAWIGLPSASRSPVQSIFTSVPAVAMTVHQAKYF